MSRRIFNNAFDYKLITVKNLYNEWQKVLCNIWKELSLYFPFEFLTWIYLFVLITDLKARDCVRCLWTFSILWRFPRSNFCVLPCLWAYYSNIVVSRLLPSVVFCARIHRFVSDKEHWLNQFSSDVIVNLIVGTSG